MKALITRKVGMTSTIAEDGTVAAVTLLSASPNVVTQVKTVETDGYTAVQVGFETAKKQNVTKALQGHFKSINTLPKIKSGLDRKSTRLNSSHQIISYAVFCLKKKNN